MSRSDRVTAQSLPSRRSTLPLALGLLFLIVTSAPAQKETFGPEHVARLRSVTAVALSPDGQQAAYVLSVPHQLPKDKDGPARAELHVVGSDGVSRPFITGPVNVSAVRWTPDGRSISFVARRTGDEHQALYVISAHGGEARRVLTHGSDIQSYSWAPDGKRVAYLATEPVPKEKRELRELGFNQQVYEEDTPFVYVWIANVTDEEPKGRKLDLPGSASGLHWSPKGDRLALALAPQPWVDHQYMFRRVRVVDVETGKVTAQLDNPGKLGEIAWSPDAQHIAAVSAVDRHDPHEGRIWVAPAEGGKWRDLTPDYPGHVSSIAWRDNDTILYVGDVGVWTELGEVDLGGGKPRQLIPPREGPIFAGLSLAKDGRIAALLGNTPRHPSEVFLLEVGTGEPRRVTNNNPWLKDLRFAPQEVVSYQARDGLKLQGILVRPLEAKPGQRYPLVLTVHGGPEAHVPNGWVTSYANLGQVGAARGFAVFYPNYRGSTGRGVEFSKLGQADAAGKEFDDLVDAVDHLIEMGLVDRTRVGITGGSYGGYATAWCSTYYSDRFAAGVMFVGISNNLSKVGTTDIPYEMYLVHHRKWLWEDWDYFLKRSPVYYVEKARTPLLILHGKEDPRVHPGQSLELYRHLKILDQAPVRLVLYPGEGHGNRRSASRMDYHLRLLRWMTHYLQGPGGKPPAYELDYGPIKPHVRPAPEQADRPGS